MATSQILSLSKVGLCHSSQEEDLLHPTIIVHELCFALAHDYGHSLSWALASCYLINLYACSGGLEPTSTRQTMPFLPIDLLSVCICALVALSYYSRKRVFSRSASYLPGPRGNIFFGNMFQIPVKEPWKAFQKWSQTYGSCPSISIPYTHEKSDHHNFIGDAFTIRLLTRPTVILCSTQAAFELLEKRSHIYSDRLPSVMDEL